MPNEHAAPNAEIPLSGGNMNAGVVRVGDTVRRPAGPWTPAVHALLEHLHGVGFRGAPRPLGIDEYGREVITYVEGVVSWPEERFGLLDPDSAIRAVARLIRDFHDAVADFNPPPDARWQVLIPAEGSDTIIHGDLAPWNLIVDGDRYTIIDWDVAAPGSRLWDVAYALHGFVPLAAVEQLRRGNTEHRVRVFAEAYGLDEAERRALVPMLGRRTRSMADFLAAQAVAGTEPWSTLWREGHGAAWQADTEYIERQTDRWMRALDLTTGTGSSAPL